MVVVLVVVVVVMVSSNSQQKKMPLRPDAAVDDAQTNHPSVLSAALLTAPNSRSALHPSPSLYSSTLLFLLTLLSLSLSLSISSLVPRPLVHKPCPRSAS